VEGVIPEDMVDECTKRRQELIGALLVLMFGCRTVVPFEAISLSIILIREAALFACISLKFIQSCTCTLHGMLNVAVMLATERYAVKLG